MDEQEIMSYDSLMANPVQAINVLFLLFIMFEVLLRYPRYNLGIITKN